MLWELRAYKKLCEKLMIKSMETSISLEAIYNHPKLLQLKKTSR